MQNLYSYLQYWAKLRPQSIAIQSTTGALSYRRLLELSTLIAIRLKSAGVVPGSLVMTCTPSKEIDWIITLAIFSLGGVSCSNHGFRAIPENLGVDFVVSEKVLDSFPLEKTLIIDKNWFSGAIPEGAELSVHAYAPSEFCRLTLTSGTTGIAKAVPLTFQQIEGRSMSWITMWSAYGAQFNLFAISSTPGFYSVSGALISGGVVFQAYTPDEVLKLLGDYKIGLLYGSPSQVAGLLRVAQYKPIKLSFLRLLLVGGGVISAKLLDLLQKNICANVANYYGATEVGGMCTGGLQQADLEQGVMGFTHPSTQIQVVNDRGNPIPSGEIGAIRVKTAFMVKSYYKASKKDNESFKSGWFYPGDLGKILPDGRLAIAGRQSEIINIGGVKVNPLEVDREMQNYPGVNDGVVFSVEDSSGIEVLCAVIVADEDFDFQGLGAYLVERVGAARSPVRFFPVKEVLRNQMGKALRRDIAKNFSGAI